MIGLVRPMFILGATALLANSAHAQLPDTLPPRPFSAGTVHHHASRLLGERREYFVYLPPAYADTSFGLRRYPVIYVLDAPVVWQFVVGAHNLLVDWGAQWPHAIVIGVTTAQRTRDFTPTRDSVSATGEVVAYWNQSGGGPTFLRYLEEELIPTVERQFLASGHRTLVGHSLGGLFALYALSERPALFRNYLVLDPVTWWANGAVERSVPETLQRGLRGPLAVFLGRADLPTDGPTGEMLRRMTAGQVALGHRLEALQVDGLRSRVRHYPGEEHVPMVIPATHEALRWFFGGLLVPEGVLGDVAGLEAHVRRTGRELGLDTVPDPREVSLAAEDLLGTPSFRPAALELLRLNVRSHPERARSHRDLGHALAVIGDTVAARASLREALRLAPGDTAVVRRMRELGGR